MKKKIKLPSDAMIRRVDGIMDMDSLDRPVIGEEGNEVTLADTLVNYDQARAMRVRAWLISMCKTKIQEKIVNMLFEGYEKTEIADELKIHYDSVTRIIRDIRKQCLELENLHKSLKRL